MVEGPYIAEVASLVADPTRANILAALMSGQALTATELALTAGVTPQTGSGHLRKLCEGRLITVLVQGRHRYYRLQSVDVARMLEVLMAMSVAGPPRHRPKSLRDAALAEARTCYDHLAGRIAVAIADQMMAREMIELEADGGRLTEAGRAALNAFGVSPTLLRSRREGICRPCLDWSERRLHIGGRMGTNLFARMQELGWVSRVDGSRRVDVTATGRLGLESVFGVAT